MNAPVRISSINYEVVSGHWYVLRESDLCEGRNRLGIDVSHLPLNVPLCGGCDAQLDCGVCHSCEVVNVDLEQWPETEGDPLLGRRVA